MTKKVRMKETVVGAKIHHRNGEVVILPAKEADNYVDKGIAEYVDKAEGVKPSAPPAKRSRKATSKRKTEKR